MLYATALRLTSIFPPSKDPRRATPATPPPRPAAEPPPSGTMEGRGATVARQAPERWRRQATPPVGVETATTL